MGGGVQGQTWTQDVADSFIHSHHSLKNRYDKVIATESRAWFPGWL